jgi:hypothetical protein
MDTIAFSPFPLKGTYSTSLSLATAPLFIPGRAGPIRFQPWCCRCFGGTPCGFMESHRSNHRTFKCHVPLKGAVGEPAFGLVRQNGERSHSKRVNFCSKQRQRAKSVVRNQIGGEGIRALNHNMPICREKKISGISGRLAETTGGGC